MEDACHVDAIGRSDRPRTTATRPPVSANVEVKVSADAAINAPTLAPKSTEPQQNVKVEYLFKCFKNLSYKSKFSCGWKVSRAGRWASNLADDSTRNDHRAKLSRWSARTGRETVWRRGNLEAAESNQLQLGKLCSHFQHGQYIMLRY